LGISIFYEHFLQVIEISSKPKKGFFAERKDSERMELLGKFEMA